MSFLTPKRRWMQFSLGTMLLAVTLLCLWLADYVSPVRKLERQLSDPDENVRTRAADRLGYMGPDARSTANSLLSLAKNSTSSPVRVKAVWALSRVSGRTELLEPFLTDKDVEVCLTAAEGMLWMGYDPRKLVPTLLELSFKSFTNSGVDGLFEALGPSQSALVVPLLIDSVRSADEADREDEVNSAISALTNVLLPEATVVPALIDLLNSHRPEVRTAAAEQLLRQGTAAKEALPALRARLHDSNRACAAACAAAVGAMDPDDPDFLRVLVEAFKSDDLQLSGSVGTYFFMLGPNAANAADDVVRYLYDERRPHWDEASSGLLKRLGPGAVRPLDGKLRQALADRTDTPGSARAVALCLGSQGSSAASAAPTLIAALENLDLQYYAIFSLGSIGHGAAPAVPHLLTFIDGNDKQLRGAAILALEKIGACDEAVRERLRPMLTSGDRDERAHAALALASSGAPAEQVLPTLLKSVIAPHLSQGWAVPLDVTFCPDMDEVLMNGIASLGPAAVALLVHALEDDNPDIRRVAAEALGRIGPPAKEAVPRLIELLDDEEVWDAAAEALGGIGPEARSAVPTLTETLKAMHRQPNPSDYPEVVALNSYLPLLHALAGMGPESRAATVEVLRLTNSDDGEIRQEAVIALARIDPANPSLIRRMRRMLAEWERACTLNNDHWGPLKNFADVVWHLGPRAEPLVPDLQRMMTAPLLAPYDRCYAAFALARFDAHRDLAVAYLQQTVNASFPVSFDSMNLAYYLLQRINGVDNGDEYLMTPFGVGP